MTVVLGSLALLILVLAAALQFWRRMDQRLAARVWHDLRTRQAAHPATFDPAMVADLPDAARRYFEFTISPGTRLRGVVEISMSGEIGLGSKDKPGYLPMRARQIIAPPHGLVWQVSAGRGAMQVVGSDGCDGTSSWVRLWFLGMIPAVRTGGTRDHVRAAFGRVVAEAAIFAPATLLPQNGVIWQAVDDRTARATVRAYGMTQTVDISTDDSGRPDTVVMQRWSDANPDRTWREQPFGGRLSVYRVFDGYRLPTRVEAGNFFGTGDYFPFYRVEIESVSFPDRKDAGGSA